MATLAQPAGDLAPSPTIPETVVAIDVPIATPREKDDTDHLASRILLWSFVAAIVLAIGGFIVVSVYLFDYLSHAFTAFDTQSMSQLSNMEITKLQPILLARAGLWKFILQSCGIIAGVAFGFLGFALFLIGAKGDMDASFDDSKHKVQLSRMAPGGFVILIAAVLIGCCSLNKVDLEFGGVTTTTERKAVPSGTTAPQTPAPAQKTNTDPPPDPNERP